MTASRPSDRRDSIDLPDRDAPTSAPGKRTVALWRRYLADEAAEAAAYRRLAERRGGDEARILNAVADAEDRHADHWRTLLAHYGHATKEGSTRASLSTQLLATLSAVFGTVIVLAMVQRSESRSPYEDDAWASESMRADERIHAEVVRGLAAKGRNRMAGSFRAAVFGANDGLVSNLALVLGVGASGVSPGVILLTGISGLLAGALSMGAGEYVSVHSQRELLEASTPDPEAHSAVAALDFNANELALVYQARGLSREEAEHKAAMVLRSRGDGAEARGTRGAAAGGDDATEHGGGMLPIDLEGSGGAAVEEDDERWEAVGTGLSAAVSSFLFFASGAVVPILPYIFGLTGAPAMIVAATLVTLALLTTGGVVGILSGASPVLRGLRQAAIGLGAAAITVVLGLLFGTQIG